MLMNVDVVVENKSPVITTSTRARSYMPKREFSAEEKAAHFNKIAQELMIEPMYELAINRWGVLSATIRKFDQFYGRNRMRGIIKSLAEDPTVEAKGRYLVLCLKNYMDSEVVT